MSFNTSASSNARIRSWLFTPATRPERFANATKSGVDVLIVDLEDAIPPDQKAAARNEVRRLLDYCGLPFEEKCLQFYQNDRAVRTASSEQVRQPIFREGLDQWQHFEPWLGPLKESLGGVLQDYT